MNKCVLRKVLFFFIINVLVLASFDVVAQRFPWQINFQLGRLDARSNFSINPIIEHSSFNANTTPGQWWQVGAERKLTSLISIRAGVGRMRLPYMITTYQELIDGSGRVRLTSGGGGNGGDMLTFIYSGLNFNVPIWGPFAVVSGVDLNIRYNDRAKSTFVFGSLGKTTVVESRDTLRLSHSFRFIPEATPNFTLSVAPHIGINWQFWERTIFSVSGTYNIGLGYVRKATSMVEANNERALASFEHRGSFVSYQIGIAYTFGAIRPNL